MTSAFSTNRAHFDAGYAGIEQAQVQANRILELARGAMAEIARGWPSSAGQIYQQAITAWTEQHNDITQKMARIGVLLQTTQAKSARANAENLQHASQIAAALAGTGPAAG